MTKDIRMTITIRNNHLIKYREENKLTQKTMAEMCDIPVGIYCPIELLRNYPKWPQAERIASVVGRDIEEIFPDYFKDIKKRRFYKEVDKQSLEQLSHYPSQTLLPDDTLEKAEMERDVADIVKSLTSREALVINLRYGLEGKQPHTLDQVASLPGWPSRERIRQIEQRALRKMRHPQRAKCIKEFTE